jgi:hypothetical protein
MVILQQDNLLYLQNQNRTQRTTPVQVEGKQEEENGKENPHFPKRFSL